MQADVQTCSQQAVRARDFMVESSAQLGRAVTTFGPFGVTQDLIYSCSSYDSGASMIANPAATYIPQAAFPMQPRHIGCVRRLGSESAASRCLEPLWRLASNSASRSREKIERREASQGCIPHRRCSVPYSATICIFGTAASPSCAIQHTGRQGRGSRPWRCPGAEKRAAARGRPPAATVMGRANAFWPDCPGSTPSLPRPAMDHEVHRNFRR